MKIECNRNTVDLFLAHNNEEALAQVRNHNITNALDGGVILGLWELRWMGVKVPKNTGHRSRKNSVGEPKFQTERTKNS